MPLPPRFSTGVGKITVVFSSGTPAEKSFKGDVIAFLDDGRLIGARDVEAAGRTDVEDGPSGELAGPCSGRCDGMEFPEGDVGRARGSPRPLGRVAQGC